MVSGLVLTSVGSKAKAFNKAKETFGLDRDIWLALLTLLVIVGAEETVTSRTGTSNIDELTDEHFGQKATPSQILKS